MYTCVSMLLSTAGLNNEKRRLQLHKTHHHYDGVLPWSNKLTVREMCKTSCSHLICAQEAQCQTTCQNPNDVSSNAPINLHVAERSGRQCHRESLKNLPKSTWRCAARPPAAHTAFHQQQLPTRLWPAQQLPNPAGSATKCECPDRLSRHPPSTCTCACMQVRAPPCCNTSTGGMVHLPSDT